MNNLELNILYEDNHLLILNKPSGILVQGDDTGDWPLVEYAKEYIKKKYKKLGAVFLGVVHRLDRPVSGAIVFARTSKSLERMNSLFRNRKTIKTYWALVSNLPSKPEDILTHWLKKDEKKNKTTAYKKETLNSLKSELSYKVLDVVKGNYLVEVKPITGRSHQIRVQLSSIGCPIIGDVKYGYPLGNDDGSIHLHARQIEFEHPVKKVDLKIIAPLPDHPLWQYFGTFER